MEFDAALFEASFTKRFGREAIIDLLKRPSIGEPGTFVPTPATTLNRALLIGGLNKGALIEVYGPPSSGKTTLGVELLKAIQDYTQKPVLFIDAEHVFDMQYGASIGLNRDRSMLYFNQESGTEDVLNMVHEGAKSGLGAILVDSLPALTAKAQMDDADVTDARYGGNARLLSDSLKRIKPVCNATGTIIILINQIRSKIGVVYGSAETRPGGNALPFYADCIMRTSVVQTPDYLLDKKTGEVFGVRIKADIKKLKWGPPHRCAEYDILFGKGIDQIGSLVDAAIQGSIIIKKGSWFSFGEESLGQGRAAVRALLATKPDLAETITQALWTGKQETQEVTDELQSVAADT